LNAERLLIVELGNTAANDLADHNFEPEAIVLRDENFRQIDQGGSNHAARPVSDVVRTQKGHLEAGRVTRIVANGPRFGAIRPLTGHKRTLAAMIIDANGLVFSEMQGQSGHLEAPAGTMIVASGPVLNAVRLRADQIVGLAETTSVASGPVFGVIQPRVDRAEAQIAPIIVASGANFSSGLANLGRLDAVQKVIAAVKIGPADRVADQLRAGPDSRDGQDRTLVPAAPAAGAVVLAAAMAQNVPKWPATHRKQG
jgi:hypothetical protein